MDEKLTYNDICTMEIDLKGLKEMYEEKHDEDADTDNMGFEELSDHMVRAEMISDLEDRIQLMKNYKEKTDVGDTFIIGDDDNGRIDYGTLRCIKTNLEGLLDIYKSDFDPDADPNEMPMQEAMEYFLTRKGIRDLDAKIEKLEDYIEWMDFGEALIVEEE